MASGPDVLSLVAPVLGLFAVLGYGWLAVRVRGRRWHRTRGLSWIAGVLAATAGVSGPLARAAEHSFAAHMITHLLVGMAAPLMVVLAAPVTLLLRSLPVHRARRLSRVLRSRPVRVLTEPAVAAVLDVGGLWLLYTTGLYSAMHRSMAVHVLVHLHVFAAGCLFSVSLVGVDPMPHRRSLLHRSVVVIIALAAHDVLAKYLYARPPGGVSESDAHLGAMIMYYGGDGVDLIIIALLCAAWFRSSGRRLAARPVIRC